MITTADPVAGSKLGRAVSAALARKAAGIIAAEVDVIASRIGLVPPAITVEWTADRFRNGGDIAAGFIGTDEDPEAGGVIVLNARAFGDETGPDARMYALALAAHEAAHAVAFHDGERLTPWPASMDQDEIDRHAHGPLFHAAAVRVAAYCSVGWPDPPDPEDWRALRSWPTSSLTPNDAPMVRHDARPDELQEAG